MMAAVEREAVAGGRAIVRPGAAIVIVVLALIALVIGINAVIENYRDQIALKGYDGKPLPVALIIAGEGFTIPANMIRFRSERRGGTVEQIDLAFRLPSL